MSFPVFAKDVSIERARKVATTFLQQSTATTLKSATQLELTLVTDFLTGIQETNPTLKSAGTDSPEMFAFNINQNTGFIIVSGDDAAFPILAYSDEQGIPATGFPPNIASWLDHYRQQIRYLKEHQIEPTEDVKMQWDGVYSRLKSAQNSVAPLTTTKWYQDSYYNAKCPYDSMAEKRTLTGCSATAMAQILKFWEYPSKGFGFHSYQHQKYGILSADFDTTSYNWAAMPDIVTAPNDAVATLMYHCGVAIDMDYGVSESGGRVIPVSYDIYAKNLFDASKSYFGYSKSIQALTRNYGHEMSEWTNMLKSELDSGRPILYEGYDSENDGGHEFICDGYDDQDNFHFNWGWGGLYNGYFRLEALIPPNKYNFNFYQTAIIGIKPPEDAVVYQLALNNPVETNKVEIKYGEGFTISVDILNKGTLDFKGDFCVAIYDDQYNLVDSVEIKTEQSLGAGVHFPDGLSFSSRGLSTMVPGTYRAYILYRSTNGEWIILQTDISDKLTKNFAEIKVSHKNVISLYSTIDLPLFSYVFLNGSSHITKQPVLSNDSLSVYLNVVNDSIKDFTD
ncbi:MAG TPA: C10 family peptidase [Prolixibacteraceae bacterium]|nr:C10 family peptidase [Prolixibacteraceae bacterium]